MGKNIELSNPKTAAVIAVVILAIIWGFFGPFGDESTWIDYIFPGVVTIIVFFGYYKGFLKQPSQPPQQPQQPPQYQQPRQPPQYQQQRYQQPPQQYPPQQFQR